MFEPKAFDQIFTEMRDRTPPRISDFEEGSVARTLYESFAFELALLYEQMHQVYLSAFVDTATGSQLDLVVAVLGIKRGEPDFAMGVVTFERDRGMNEPLAIPIGFLVTTSEDTQDTVKKAYRTIETRTMAETESRIEVRVQAVEPGEGQVAEANTVRVMPQPLPGIKVINNEQAIRFTGKHQETDEELRNRAKITLLAASGANVTAIETALMSLPGVREARVRENFQYARGTVILRRKTRNRTAAAGEVIPAKTVLVSQTANKRFLTQESVPVPNGAEQVVKVEAVIQGAAGQVTEANTDWQDLTYQSSSGGVVSITVRNDEPLILRDFGVIEVFVDGVNFNDPDQVGRLHSKIEEVRAAGIYVFLKPTQTVQVDGVFLLELKPGKRFSTAERLILEQQLQAALITHLEQQRMGQPLLISQLTQTLLAAPAVNDLVDFELTIKHPISAEVIKITPSSNKRLDAEIMEKFVPGRIWVATEIKPLIVDIQMKVSTLSAASDPDASPGPSSDSGNVQAISFKDKAQQIQTVLERYFNPDRGLDDPSALLIIQKQDIVDQVIAEVTQIEIEKTTLIPRFWQAQMVGDLAPGEVETVEVSLVEQAQLGNVLIYHSELQISGAIKLSLPLQTPTAERERIEAQVRQHLQAYVDQLKPKQDLDIDQFVQAARAVESVLAVSWKAEDFAVRRLENGISMPVPEVLQPGTKIIPVAEFEKVILAPDEEFVIASLVQPVMVSLTDLVIRAEIFGVPPNTDRDRLEVALQLALRASLETFCQQLPQPAVGESLNYDDLAGNRLPELMRRACANLPWSKIRRLLVQPTPALNASFNTLDEAEIDRWTDLTNDLLKGARFIIQTLNLNGDIRDISVRITEWIVLAELRPGEVRFVLVDQTEVPPASGGTGGGTGSAGTASGGVT